MAVGDRRKNDPHLNATGAAASSRQDDRRKTDRRSTPRVGLELWIEEVLGDDVYFRRTGNLGEGGVYFDKAIPHAIGTMVTLKFALPDDKEMVVARGEVVSIAGSEEGLGMGVKFITVEGDGQVRIRELIRTVMSRKRA